MMVAYVHVFLQEFKFFSQLQCSKSWKNITLSPFLAVKAIEGDMV